MSEAPPPGLAAPEPDGAWRRRATLAIGPLLLVLILSTLDPAELFAVFRDAEVAPLAAAYAVPLPAILLRVLRWRILMGSLAGRWRASELVAIYARSIAIGVLTPGRLGELSRGALVARRGGGWGPALWSALVDRLSDLVFLALLAAGAAALYAAPSAGDALLLGAVAGGIVAGSAGLWLLGRSGTAARWRRRLLARSGRASDGAGTVERLGPGDALACAVLTVVSWAVTYAANYLFCLGLGLPVGYLEIAGISAVASLVASLPISIAGAGTRDAALIAMLGPFGVDPAQAVALSTLMLSNVLFGAAVCALGFARPLGGRSQ